MDAIFKLSRSGLTDLVVTSLEYDNDEYLNEDSDILISVRNYAYSHTVTLNVLTYVSMIKPKIKTHEIIKHYDGCIDESIFKMDEDGLFEISHIILPNKKWFDYCLSFGNDSSLNEYKEVYFYDEDENKFMKYTSKDLVECSLEDILKAYSGNKTCSTDEITTIIRSDKSTFNMFYIRKCLAELCSNILNSKMTACRTNSSLEEDVFKRDILFMAVSSIKFAIDNQQFYEAQRILNSLKTCAGICTSDKSSYNCNCN